jgi:hypothetical protein
METLNPKGECEAPPSTYEIFGTLPEEDGNSATSNPSHRAGEDEHAPQGSAGGVDGWQDAKL